MTGMPRLVLPVVPAGRMRDHEQPALSLPGGLALRPWRPSDAPVVLAAYGDKAIQWWHRRSLESADEALELITAWTQAWRDERAAHWAVVTSPGAPGRVAGRLSLRVDLELGLRECGYWVLPAGRGEGVAPRALAGLTSWALDDLGLHRIELGHSVANQASCRVAAKAGYRLEGTLRSALLHADGWHDMHLHATVAG
jgi:RimJ/RimL family protein N-acetyltransferase